MPDRNWPGGCWTGKPNWADECRAYDEAMIEFKLDPKTAILTIHPRSALEKNDFVELGQAVDPEIEKHGDLAGLVLDASHFPGWDSFGALVTHLKFIRDHHRHVKKIAVVTDSPMGDAAEHITSHFVSAEIKHFPAGQTEQAEAWIAQG